MMKNCLPYVSSLFFFLRKNSINAFGFCIKLNIQNKKNYYYYYYYYYKNNNNNAGKTVVLNAFKETNINVSKSSIKILIKVALITGIFPLYLFKEITSSFYLFFGKILLFAWTNVQLIVVFFFRYFSS